MFSLRIFSRLGIYYKSYFKGRLKWSFKYFILNVRISKTSDDASLTEGNSMDLVGCSYKYHFELQRPCRERTYITSHLLLDYKSFTRHWYYMGYKGHKWKGYINQMGYKATQGSGIIAWVIRITQDTGIIYMGYTGHIWQGYYSHGIWGTQYASIITWVIRATKGTDIIHMERVFCVHGPHMERVLFTWVKGLLPAYGKGIILFVCCCFTP